MNESRILDVIRRVVAADLPSATENVAIRLILRANQDVGQVNLTWEELTALARCESRDNARRHLIRLADHKLIHYSTNDNIYVTWLAWLMEDMAYDPFAATKNARGSAKSARGSANSVAEESEDYETTKNARGSAESARGSADSALQRSFSVTLSSSSSSSSEIEGDYEFREDLVPQAKRMLRECGIYPNDAERMAQAYAFEVLREHIFTWRADKNARGPGSLKHRIEHNFHRSPLTHDDRQSAFYWRFRTPEEEYAAEPEPAAVAGAEQPATEPPTPPQPPADLDLWQRTLQDLEMMMPAQTYSMISSASLITATENELLLSVPAFAMTMLERLQVRIQREIKRIAGKPMAVQFVPAEAAHAH